MSTSPAADHLGPTADHFGPYADQPEPSAAQLDLALELVKGFLNGPEPDRFSGEDAERLVVKFTKIKRAASAGAILYARRAEKTGVHEREGHKQAGSWLSNLTGEPVGKAASDLDAARAMEAHPEIAEAFLQGDISESQARQIASVADQCPDKARELIKEAQSLTFGELKKKCSDARSGSSSAYDEIARHERIRKSRFCRTWVDSEGAGHLEALLTPDALGVVKASLGCFEREIFAEARKNGIRESRQAYMADALVAMARASVARTGTGGSDDNGDDSPGSGPNDNPGSGPDGRPDDSPDNDGDDSPGSGPDRGSPSGSDNSSTRRRRVFDPKALIRFRIDADAFFRGYAEPGETCEIPGVGPVPVAMVRELLGEAILELVITKGTDVTTVVSDSRYVAKALRIALEERDPVCVVPGCDRSDPLEIDHWRVDFKDDGPTSIDNLARLCSWHHHQKTNRGWKLEGGPGQWTFTKPDRSPGTDAPDRAGPESEVTDTASGREAKRRATPVNDPPFQEPLL